MQPPPGKDPRGTCSNKWESESAFRLIKRRGYTPVCATGEMRSGSVNASLSKQRRLQSTSDLLGKFSKDKKDPLSLAPLPQCRLCGAPTSRTGNIPSCSVFLQPRSRNRARFVGWHKETTQHLPQMHARAQPSSSCPRSQPCSAPPPFTYTQHKIPISQFQPKSRLSLAQQPASPTSMLCPDSSEPNPGASSTLPHRPSVTPVSHCCPHRGDGTPSPPPATAECGSRGVRAPSFPAAPGGFCRVKSVVSKKHLRREQDSMAFPRA